MPAIKRVVFLAHYKTDQQNPASIEAQMDLGKELVEREGRHLVDVFVDAGVRGSSFETRPGLPSALAGSNREADDGYSRCPNAARSASVRSSA